MSNNKCILIVDDSELNRSLLSDILGDGYNIVEAVNGQEAIDIMSRYQNKIDLVLLDIIMPCMDGFEVLAMMNKAHWVDFIPVIIISAETSIKHVEHAYDLGAIDYINRPFEPKVVHQRVKNTLALYERQRRLQGLVYDQIYDKEKNNQLMIEILSHIVEFRNGESGLHVLHIRIITEMLLNALMKKTDQYALTPKQINIIVNASALHDIGKISIDEKILNKPARLTSEEFELMKKHSAIGAEMLEKIAENSNEELIQCAREVCRWHHERWDGKGYPDGLKGDEIPVSAQVVALADVYDALTSERVYKAAYSHQKALEMIINGECGQFNPILMDCLLDISQSLKNELKLRSLKGITAQEVERITNSIVHNNEYKVSDRTLYLLDVYRRKHDFYFKNAKDIFFEYEYDTNILRISKWASMLFKIPETIIDPLNNTSLLRVLNRDELLKQFHNREWDEDQIVFPIKINCHKKDKEYIFVGQEYRGDSDKQKLGICGELVERNMNLEAFIKEEYSCELYRIIQIIEKLFIDHPENDYVLTIIQINEWNQMLSSQKQVVTQRVMTYLESYLHKDDIVSQINEDVFVIFEKKRDFNIDFHDMIEKIQKEGISIQSGTVLFPEHGTTFGILFIKAVIHMYQRNTKSSFLNHNM